MKTYLRLYRWSMQMKLHMALYTFAAVFFKIICNLLQGSRQVSIVDLATIWLVSLVFAILETVLFPENAPCTKGRSLLWLAAANLCFVGGALLFGWFQGVPVWGGALLILGLELGLGMMWFGDRFVLKMDTAQLNEQLLRYQQHSFK